MEMNEENINSCDAMTICIPSNTSLLESSATINIITPVVSEQNAECTLSKNKQKKLRKLAQWEIRKKEKRQNERKKYKEKRMIAAAQGVPGPNAIRKALKRNTIENSTNPIRVAIDLDYDEQMIDKDVSKCAKQLLWVYTLNRKTTAPIQLYYTSLRENSRIVDAISRNDGYVNWDVKLKQESYMDIFEKSSIVYLTSDSETVLEALDPNSVYIIGGLVDHNHHKGLSLSRAEERGFRTARLPLGEHVSMKTRTVLTIVHVFDIILRVSQGQGWQEAILEVLPQRKFKPSISRKKARLLLEETKKEQKNQEASKERDNISEKTDNRGQSLENVVENVP